MVAIVVCTQHKDRPLVIYCYTCEDALCLSCFFCSHKHHDCALLEDAAAIMRDQLAVIEREGTDEIARIGQKVKWLEELKVRVVYLKDKGNDVEVVTWTTPLKQQFEEIVRDEFNPEDNMAAGSPMPNTAADIIGGIGL